MTACFSPLRFRLNSLRRATGNLSLFRNRGVKGQLVSMHQSGTHWLKHIIACALANCFEIPPPKYNHANDIFGGPRDPVVYPLIPRLVSSHSNPHPFILFDLVHSMLDLPRYVLLVRDIRYSLLSNYAKWSHVYRVPFSTYLRGDVRGSTYNSDIWWAIRFLNHWGRVYERLPSRVTIVRYESLMNDSTTEISRLNEFWELGLSQSDIDYGIRQSSKPMMAKKNDPERPEGAVRKSADTGLNSFSESDRDYLESICTNYLRFSAGYDYANW